MCERSGQAAPGHGDRALRRAGLRRPGFADLADALDDATAKARERVVALATGSPRGVKPDIHSAPTP
jgi:hypothetical protein